MERTTFETKYGNERELVIFTENEDDIRARIYAGDHFACVDVLDVDMYDGSARITGWVGDRSNISTQVTTTAAIGRRLLVEAGRHGLETVSSDRR